MTEQHIPYEAKVVQDIIQAHGATRSDMALVNLSVTPQWAELIRMMQTARNNHMAAMVINLSTLEVGCIISFETTRL